MDSLDVLRHNFFGSPPSHDFFQAHVEDEYIASVVTIYHNVTTSPLHKLQSSCCFLGSVFRCKYFTRMAIFTVNPCLLEWTPFMLSPFKGNHHVYEISSFIAILMLWPVNRQAASLGPKGLRKSYIFLPKSLQQPRQSPPKRSTKFGTIQNLNIDIIHANPSLNHHLRSSSKGRP